jgi:hypothetical protein
MSVDWSEVWSSAVQAAEDVVNSKVPAAKKYVRGILEAREKRLKLLLLCWADGALDQASLEEELEQERDIVEVEFLAIKVMVKKAAQDAANAVFNVIENHCSKESDLRPSRRHFSWQLQRLCCDSREITSARSMSWERLHPRTIPTGTGRGTARNLLRGASTS